MLNDHRIPNHRIAELAFLERLVDQHALVAGDVLTLGPQSWVIHGSIAGDGEVIMAAFDRLEAAAAVLDDLKPNLAPTTSPLRPTQGGW